MEFMKAKEIDDESTIATEYTDMESCPGVAPNKSPSSKVVGEDEAYLLKHKYAYGSIAFSAIQTFIVISLAAGCHVAPLDINPMLGPYPDALDRFGAKNAVMIVDQGQRWRLLTPILLHAGFFHLLCNLTVQLEVGSFFEREWGTPTWFLIYTTGSMGATLLSACVHPNTISVGSSGAAMALLGAKCSEVLCKAREESMSVQDKLGREVRKQQIKGILCHLSLITLCSFVPLVDWSSHLGGFISGIFLGLLLFSFSIKRKLWLGLYGFSGFFFSLMYVFITLQYLYGRSMDRLDDEERDSLTDLCAFYKESLENYDCQCSA
mmetsp:Transcript_1914/g.4164  ORF Transcript_1914/g.4164 Transcript_1914/m.4164 type:complete len:321 (-) Transcript_1914:43-1005(-)